MDRLLHVDVSRAVRRYQRVLGAVTLFALLLTRASAPAEEPFYDGLGKHTLRVTTNSDLAQRYFNQGLAFLHGFNHAAAIRSFREAAHHDAQCAMARWGIAYAHGPHINFPLVPPDAAEIAWKELQAAREQARHASPLEQELIGALAARYAWPQPEDRTGLDRAYAEAMRELWHRHRQNADVGAFFAEAMMNLRPWDQWTPDGKEQPGTAEIIATLDEVLRLQPEHPLANHLYIHAVEASPEPGRADAAAARLGGLQPGLAHNVHMPSHIHVRRGRWREAVESNVKAVEADRLYREKAGPPQGFLNLYRAHNRHMLAFAAMMTGQSALALEHIRELVRETPREFLRDFASVVEGYAAMPMEVMIRFGRWDEILAEPERYEDYMPLSRTIHSAARAVALAAKGDVAAARREQSEMLERAQRVPEGAAFGNNPCPLILAVLQPMVEGEIAIREGRTDEALAALRNAVKAEDALRYDEPPGWMVPTRHVLGAALLKSGRATEAEEVYREDLRRHPENGWALRGLAQSLRAQGKEGVEAAEERFRTAWREADVQIPSSCLCLPLDL